MRKSVIFVFVERRRRTGEGGPAPNTDPAHKTDRATAAVALCVALLAVAPLISACKAPQTEVHFYALNTPEIESQSARALARLFSADYPQYRIVMRLYGSRSEMITDMYTTDNAFALIDAGSAFFIDRIVDADPPISGTNIRTVFAAYQNFFHVLIDANALTDERQPRTNAPIAFHSPAWQFAFDEVGTQIFGPRANDGLRLLDTINSDTVVSLESGELGAIAFFDVYPSTLITASVPPYTRARLLPLTSSITDPIVADAPYLSVDLLPIDSYPNLINGQTLPALYIPTVLITARHTGAQLVSEVCRAFVDNFERYRTLYPHLDTLSSVDIQRGLGAAVHDGATDCR